jgi:hypothetical protein
MAPLWSFLIVVFVSSAASSRAVSKENTSRPGDVVEIFGPLPANPTRTAAIYFAEDLFSGIDDRQVFLLAITLQKLGYSIDIIVTETNACQTRHDLQIVMKTFPFSFDENHLRLVKVSTPRRALDPSLKYQVFVVNGIEKIPPVDGIGLRLNIFVCKFPSDGYREVSVSTDRYALWAALKSLSSFDFIIVPDSFTYELLVKVLLKSSLRELTQHHRAYPSVYVLPPPALLSQETLPSLITTTATTIITVTLATPYLASPSRCQQYLDTLSFLRHSHRKIFEQTSLSVHFQLILAASDPEEEEMCLRDLQASLAVGPPVTVLSLGNLTHYASRLPLSDLCWIIPWDSSMTSADKETILLSSTTADHPNRWRTFPSAALDLMVAGTIPILYSDSTTSELITDSVDGFLVESLSEYILRTVLILTSPSEARERWRVAVKQRASSFTVTRASNTLKVLMRRYLKSKSFRQFTWTSLPILRRKTIVKAAVSGESDLVAVIIEPHVVSSFEYCVKNLLLFLGMQQTNSSSAPAPYVQRWALHVFHSAGNEVFVKFVLRSVPNVVFRLLPAPSAPAPATLGHSHTASAAFWKLFEGQKKVLIFQSTTLLLQGTVTQFMQYDFVTAPSPRQKQERQSKKIAARIGSESKIYESYRSASLSLRSLAPMSVCPNLTADSLMTITDRKYFDLCWQRYQGSIPLFPDDVVSDQFCRVTPVTSTDHNTDHEDFLSHLPFAVETSWEYFSSYEALLYYKASLQAMISCC